MRGGAGTGKTWIAMKMAKDEAESNGHKVLFVCASKPLASMVNSHIGDAVNVKDIRSLFERLVEDIASYQEPLFEGISHGLIGDYEKYDAIFVDFPPVGVVVDALIPAQLITGYAVVVRSGLDDRRAVGEVLSSLNGVGARVLGFILNDVDPKLGGYGRGDRSKYKYRYRYNYSYTHPTTGGDK
jgi:Mrp family chromosome partitioning ATPase